MDLFGVIATIVVLLAIAVGILLFERRRAEQIETDLRDMARQRRSAQEPDDDPGPAQ